MILDDFANLWFKTFGDFYQAKLGFLLASSFWGLEVWGMGGLEVWSWLSFWGSISLVDIVNMNYIFKLWTINP